MAILYLHPLHPVFKMQLKWGGGGLRKVAIYIHPLHPLPKMQLKRDGGGGGGGGRGRWQYYIHTLYILYLNAMGGGGGGGRWQYYIYMLYTLYTYVIYLHTLHPVYISTHIISILSTPFRPCITHLTYLHTLYLHNLHSISNKHYIYTLHHVSTCLLLSSNLPYSLQHFF